jgi:hypothetical protein
MKRRTVTAGASFGILALFSGAAHIAGPTTSAAQACSQVDALMLARDASIEVNEARLQAKLRTLTQDTDVTRLAQERAENATLRANEPILRALAARNYKVSESKAVEVVFVLSGVLCPFDVSAVLDPDPRVQMLVRGEYTHLAVGASADASGGVTLGLIARRV